MYNKNQITPCLSVIAKTLQKERKPKIMSEKKCPKCKSKNVRPAYGNYAGKGAAIAFSLVAATINHTLGHAYFHNASKIHVKKNHCKDCGHEW